MKLKILWSISMEKMIELFLQHQEVLCHTPKTINNYKEILIGF